jgi:hypothetical protein
VFVLASHRPAGTPDHVLVDDDPVPLLGKLQAANQGRDVHLVGGPRTIETHSALGALDKLELVVLPLLLGGGMQLTPALSPDTRLTFERERALPGGSIEIVYNLSRRNTALPAATRTGPRPPSDTTAERSRETAGASAALLRRPPRKGTTSRRRFWSGMWACSPSRPTRR